MSPPRLGTPSFSTRGAPGWQREGHGHGQHQTPSQENHCFQTQMPGPSLCGLRSWKQVREGHPVSLLPGRLPHPPFKETSLPKLQTH